MGRVNFPRSDPQAFKKNTLKPWQKRHWCLGVIDATFLWRMEKILDLYQKPYDRKRPVICFDERPCQLLADVVVPLPMKPGRPKRQDYHYKRNGVCQLLMAFEPLSGKRFVQIRKRRTKNDYAEFMAAMAKNYYPEAEKIILVQDNLNTHNPSSFYQTFEAEKAFALAERFEMHYTPKKASWLNMVEIELSVVARQCLNRRIATREALEREVLALVKERNHKKCTVTWQFTKNDARDKFNKFYTS